MFVRLSAMKEHEFSFVSFQDQLEIKGTIVIPDQPIGVLQLVHGMSEHRKRYLEVMRWMAEHGWICVIHDHRGHGESVKGMQDYGYFYDQTATYLVEDTHQLTYLMKKKYEGLPYVLFGHSMGSLVVRNYIKKYDYELDALIVCGSPSKNPLAICGQMLAHMMTKWKGDHYRSPLIQKIAFGSFAKKYKHEGSENAWICSNREVVQAYDEDDGCGFVFTLNGFENLFKLMRRTYDEDDWVLLNKQLPILFIAGSDDPCIGSSHKFAQAVDTLRRIGYTNVSSKLYPEMRHEILNEQGKMNVYQDLTTFMEKNTTYSKTEEQELVKG